MPISTGWVERKAQHACTVCQVLMMMMHFTYSFVCKRWKDEMGKLADIVGHATPDNIIEIMLQSQEHWNNIASYVKEFFK